MAARTLADAQLNVEELHGVYNRLSFSPLGGRVVQWDVRRRELVPEKQRRGSEWLTVLKTNAAARSSSARFASSVMFPWCNRIGGRFWKTNDFEEIPVDTSTSNGRLHGLVYDRVFDVVRSKFNLVEFRVVLAPSKFYPFHVALNVIYELRSEMGSEFLDVKMRAENLDTRVAPVTMGVHPYFLCDRGQTTDDMEIRLRVSKEVHVDKALIPVRMGTVQRIHDFSRLTRIRDTQLDVAYAVPSRRGDDTLLGGEQQTTERGAEPESRRLKPFPEDEDAWTESESSGDEAPAAAGKDAAGGGHGDGEEERRPRIHADALPPEDQPHGAAGGDEGRRQEEGEAMGYRDARDCVRLDCSQRGKLGKWRDGGKDGSKDSCGLADVPAAARHVRLARRRAAKGESECEAEKEQCNEDKGHGAPGSAPQQRNQKGQGKGQDAGHAACQEGR